MIIGSTAIKHWFPDFPRDPKDLDIVEDEYSLTSEIKRIETETRIETLLNDVLIDYYNSKEIYPEYCEPNDLYTLKVSHLIGWDIHWEKHMWDVQWLKEKGCVLQKNLLWKLYTYWNELHGENKRSVLNMTAEDFFNNALRCPYDHDWLHTLINPIPTFNKVLKDEAEVEVDELKFNKLSFKEKCDLVVEEVMVMAYERYQKVGWQRGYNRMIKKFILSHAPLWEALFIVENYKLLQRCPFNYFKVIEEGIKQNQPIIKQSKYESIR